MKKLSDIPKRNPFEVPEGYFDKLPGVIQARVVSRDSSPAWSWSWGIALRYAIPVAVLMAAGLFWFRSGGPPPMDLQAELAQFKPEQLEEYLDHHDLLNDSDLNTDELVEAVKWRKSDVDQLEKNVYSDYHASQQEVDTILDEYDNEL